VAGAAAGRANPGRRDEHVTKIAEAGPWRTAFGPVSTATIASLLAAHGYRKQFLSGLRGYGAARLAAPAYTVRLVPSRPDLAAGPDRFRQVIETVPAGHVLVVDSLGEPRGGVIGDMLATRMAVRGGVGLVTDGAVRDCAALAGLDLGIWAAGTNADLRGSVFTVAGTQELVACADVAVRPGDIIVADADGVIAVPEALAGEVAAQGREQEDLERYLAGRLRAGEPLEGVYPPDERRRAEYASWRTATDGSRP
jgi:regulator of RNase E activity RraA